MIIQYIMDQDEANDHNTLFSMLEVEVVMMMMVWHNLAVVVNMAMLGKYSSSSCNSVWSGQDFKEKMKCSDEHEDDDVTICSKDQAALSPLAQAGSSPP